VKEDADVKEMLASLYREQKIIKNRESLLLQIKKTWHDDPDFREQLREFVQTQPSSDKPGRKPKIDTEKVQSILGLASKIGITKTEILNIICEVYGLKKESIERSLRPSRKHPRT
jgi:hypothetical protein